MKLLIFIFLFLESINSSQALANGVFDRGNGGSGVRCYQKNKTILAVLDLYEMKDQQLSLAKNIPLNFQEALEFVLNRMSNTEPALEIKVRAAIATLQKEAHFVEQSLPNINDLGVYPVLKPGCKLVQLAIQWDEQSFLGRRFAIDAQLWKQLDDINKAALIVHEAYYRTLLKSDVKFELYPVLVRRTVGYYFSENFETLKP